MNCQSPPRTSLRAGCAHVARWISNAAVLVLLLGHASCGTAAPANDTCSGAIVIPRVGPFPYLTAVTDITTATTAGDPPLEGDFYPTQVARSIWFSFTPAVSAAYTISTCAGPGLTATTADTVMVLYTSAAGCNGPFVQQGDIADQECSDQASLTQSLLADTRYFIVVWRFCANGNCPDDGLNGVQLLVNATLPPPNDTCATAVPLQVNIPVAGTTVGAGNHYQVTATNAFTGIGQFGSTAPGRDVVYSFTAPDAGTYSFKAYGYDVGQDLVIYVLTNCPAGTPPVGLNNVLAAANRSRVNSAEEVFCIPLAAGGKVFVMVDDDNLGNVGSAFIMEVTRCVLEREPNDSPPDAASLSCGVEGSISTPGGRDFFALGSYPAGWRAFVMVDGEAAGSADFEMRITTFSDTLEFDRDDNDQAFGASSPNIAGTPLTGGPAFVQLTLDGPGLSEPYRVYGVVQPPLASAVPETEPNNTTADANFADANYFLGTLNGTNPSFDMDVYAFGVAEGDLIFLSLDGDPYRTNAPINARLELLNPAGATLVVVDDAMSFSTGGTNISLGTLAGVSPTSPGEALVYRSPVEGTFYARVSISPTATGPSASGHYLLSISRNGVTGSEGINRAPSLSDIALPSPGRVGTPVALTGTIWEPDTGDAVELVVRWGDGTTNSVPFNAPGQVQFSLPHTYKTASSNYTVNIGVQDRSGATDTATASILVRPDVQPARFDGINRLPNGNFRLQLRGTPQAEYRIERRTLPAGWVPLGTRTADATGAFIIDDTAPADQSRFYRAVAD